MLYKSNSVSTMDEEPGQYKTQQNFCKMSLTIKLSSSWIENLEDSLQARKFSSKEVNPRIYSSPVVYLENNHENVNAEII
jgi:hypothetical protein